MALSKQDKIDIAEAIKEGMLAVIQAIQPTPPPPVDVVKRRGRPKGVHANGGNTPIVTAETLKETKRLAKEIDDKKPKRGRSKKVVARPVESDGLDFLPDTSERRPPAVKRKIECISCKQEFEVYPSQMKVKFNEKGAGIPVYECNDCTVRNFGK